MRDTFYNTSGLTVYQRKSICYDAYECSTAWWVDKLDCKVSFLRQRVEMSYDDIIKKLARGCHFTVVHRSDIEEYGEIGFCTMSFEPDFFLWIITTVEDLNKIVMKYGLKPKP